MQKSKVEKVVSIMRHILFDLSSISSDYVRTQDLEDWQRTTTDFINQSIEHMKFTLKQEDE